jgi:hypothetical protein
MAAKSQTGGKFRAFTAAGLPLAGGKLYTYAAGTSTPKQSYTDAINYTANANPVILDANGEANVFLDGSYKLILKDSGDVTQWTLDNIRATDARSVNTQVDDYTLLITDAYKMVEMNKASGVNLTVPANDTAAFPIGAEIFIRQYGAGQITLVAAMGVTIRTPTTLRSNVQYSELKLSKRATNEWVLSGDIDPS